MRAAAEFGKPAARKSLGAAALFARCSRCCCAECFAADAAAFAFRRRRASALRARVAALYTVHVHVLVYCIVQVNAVEPIKEGH